MNCDQGLARSFRERFEIYSLTDFSTDLEDSVALSCIRQDLITELESLVSPANKSTTMQRQGIAVCLLSVLAENTGCADDVRFFDQAVVLVKNLLSSDDIKNLEQQMPASRWL